ncbi:LysO family transporter [Clostridium aminobutyricum]|uniref:LysO family transporter n=1 Tax=Clostridium aminobutyricum TaxID=33953 RepID=A0A939D824_CLOAM|nr:LysO family transporter [Clostridium aminobutyricum]MBN7772836.1 LysO family transporter [Clostridium aminobutyricum]
MRLLILYLSMAFIGYIVGAKYTDKEKSYSWTSKVTTGCLIVLIFTMGARIGSNEEVIQSLQTIGFKAAVISVFAFAGSILACFLVRKLFRIDRKGVKADD